MFLLTFLPDSKPNGL